MKCDREKSILAKIREPQESHRLNLNKYLALHTIREIFIQKVHCGNVYGLEGDFGEEWRFRKYVGLYRQRF